MRLIDADVLRDKFIETLENIKKDPKMTREEMHIIAACDTVVQMIDDMPPVSFKQWISVEDRLPEAEVEVLVAVKDKSYPTPTITTAMYEDGTVPAEESDWWWNDMVFDYDENEEELIPQGWWEYRHYNPDCVYNNEIDGVVTHWMPLPEPPKAGENSA